MRAYARCHGYVYGVIFGAGKDTTWLAQHVVPFRGLLIGL